MLLEKSYHVWTILQMFHNFMEAIRTGMSSIVSSITISCWNCLYNINHKRLLEMFEPEKKTEQYRSKEPEERELSARFTFGGGISRKRFMSPLQNQQINHSIDNQTYHLKALWE